MITDATFIFGIYIIIEYAFILASLKSVLFLDFVLWICNTSSFLCSQKMGKKSRVKTQKSGTGATASVSPKETLNLTSELLQSKLCSWPSRLSLGHVVCTHTSQCCVGISAVPEA